MERNTPHVSMMLRQDESCSEDLPRPKQNGTRRSLPSCHNSIEDPAKKDKSIPTPNKNIKMVINLKWIVGLLLVPGIWAGAQRRRLSGALDVTTPSQVRELCKGETAFQTFYKIVDSHLLIVAESSDTACPSLAFHAKDGASKEMFRVEELGPQDTLYELGDYTLSELLRAYEQIELTDSPYDIVTNNCATFVLDMFCHLGYVTTHDLLEWTVERLLDTEESTDTVMENLHHSSHLADLPMVSSSDSRTLEDQSKDVVADLVYYYAANHEGSCIAPHSATSDNSKEPSLATVSVVMTLVWTMVALGCFWFGRRSGKNNVPEVMVVAPENHEDEEKKDRAID